MVPMPAQNPRSQPTITPFQTKVYTQLLTIPTGKITTYASLARALDSSPRAVGGALRNNPYAPTVPCHRVIASTGFVGGFKGDWEKAPSAINQSLKLKLLAEEDVRFDREGRLVTKAALVQCLADAATVQKANEDLKRIIRAWDEETKDVGETSEHFR